MSISTLRSRALAAGVVLALGAATPGLSAPAFNNAAAVRAAVPGDVVTVGGGGFAAGLFGGLVGGAIVGAAVTRPYYYYPPPAYYYGPVYAGPPVVVGPPAYADPPPYSGPERGQVRRCWDRAAGQWHSC